MFYQLTVRPTESPLDSGQEFIFKNKSHQCYNVINHKG